MRPENVGGAHDGEATEIEALLAEHPHVKDVVVLACEDDPGEKRLAAYLVADLTKLKSLKQTGSRQASAQMIDRWNRLYELTYSTGPLGPSFVGWTSSYTREAIPEDQMREWLQATLERIQALAPRRILEIGCGVGLLLQHLAPQCLAYVGTDFSASAIARLREWIGRQEGLKHVEVLKRTAIELQDLQTASFDTAVLSSVVQYFPDVEYLLSTLEGIVRLLTPGGRIFIGDVKNLRLLPTFYGAVQLDRATDSNSVGEVRRRVAQAATQETELAIEPEFFEALPGRFPGISAVEVQLRRGHAQNEMSCYRYDVVLYTGEHFRRDVIYEPLKWQPEDGFLLKVEAALRERRWRALQLCSIPNLRLARDVAVRKLLDASEKTLRVHALRRELDHLELSGTDPEAFWRWGESYGYHVSVGWGSREFPDCFEVRFLDSNKPDEIQPKVDVPTVESGRPWAEYANDPLENRIGREFILELREYLRPLVPEYAIPSVWTLLNKLPRGPRGNVDRHAL